MTDPADGRCIERTIGSRAPDADMKRQLYAADRYGRGPGSRRPAEQCEIDHETPYCEAPETSETNLNCKEILDHWRKTADLWRTVMNERRDVTWTTLLGQIAVTRGHDYRQYVAQIIRLTPLDDQTAGVHTSGDGWEISGSPVSDSSVAEDTLNGPAVERSDLAARRDLVNQVLYAALVHRAPGERTEADDDVPGSEDWLAVADAVHLSHRDADGRRRPDGPPGCPTPEDILDVMPEGEAPEQEANTTEALAQEEPKAPGADRGWGDANEPPPF
ncbi:MAG: HNH endonuclease signature motif containing protein [Brachybacterium sp.]|nr:HNH endonuclease signature motif containing protein [Brachybacterium sp.]